MKLKIHRAIGLFFLLYFFNKVDWFQMRQVFSQFDVGLLIIAFVLNLPQVLLKASRWKYFLFLQGYHLSTKRSFQYYLSSIFLGVITPGRIGEFAKVYYLRQEGKGLRDNSMAFSSVIFDRLCDLYLLFLIAMIGLVVLPPLNEFCALGWGGGVISLIFPIIILNLKHFPSSFYNRYVKYLSARIPSNLKNNAINFSNGMIALRKGLLVAGLITVVSYALFFFQCFLIAKSLDIPVPYLIIIPVMAVTNLISFLPISVSGIGTRDAALILLFGQQGISLEFSLAFSMGILLIFYVGGGVLGFFAWYMNPLKFNA